MHLCGGKMNVAFTFNSHWKTDHLFFFKRPKGKIDNINFVITFQFYFLTPYTLYICKKTGRDRT